MTRRLRHLRRLLAAAVVATTLVFTATGVAAPWHTASGTAGTTNMVQVSFSAYPLGCTPVTVRLVRLDNGFVLNSQGVSIKKATTALSYRVHIGNSTCAGASTGSNYFLLEGFGVQAGAGCVPVRAEFTVAGGPWTEFQAYKPDPLPAPPRIFHPKIDGIGCPAWVVP